MLTTDAIEAPPEFRAKILALLLNSDWMLHYGTAILPEYFVSDDEKALVTWVNSYYSSYRSVPDDTDAKYALQDNKAYKMAMTCTESDTRYVADVALEFAKAQAMKLTILSSVEDIRKGNLMKPLDRIKEAQRVGTDLMELGQELVADAKSWVYDQLHGPRYPTGWIEVDNLLGGGTVAGEYLLLMAATGKGKTTGLVNIGFSVAGLMCKANVLHITHEIAVYKVLARYGARATGIRLKRDNEFLANEAEFITALTKRASQVLGGRIRVIQPGRKLSDIKRAVDNLVNTGFVPGYLIDDYLDLMVPERKRTELRFELGDMTRDLRDYGKEIGVPVASATQAGRQALRKKVVALDDIAEAIDKAAASDVVISLCQSDDEEKLGRGRLFMAKVRDAKGGLTFPVKIDLEKQLITCLQT